MEIQVLYQSNMRTVAEAAAMSYGKDIAAMSDEDIEKYIKKIWDKHTNISEHYVATIKLTNIPRILTFLMAFQRYGFTMTEFSQRRRMVSTNNVEYHELIAKQGIPFEEARKVLSVLEPSECIVTLNREAAKSIVRILHKHLYSIFEDTIIRSGIILHLEDIFSFSAKSENVNTKFFSMLGIDGDYPQVQKHSKNHWTIALPMYSLHQLIRHRTLDILQWGFVRNVESIEQVKNDTLCFLEFKTDKLDLLKKTRTTPATQEPLRTIVSML